MHPLISLFPRPVELIWHENTSFYLKVEKRKKNLVVKLHRLFEKAPSPVLEAVVQFVLKKDPKAKKVLKEMVQLSFFEEKPSLISGTAKGRVYDLQEILDRLKAPFSKVDVSIRWGKKSQIGKRHITFGSFSLVTRQIRIHPALDQEKIPSYFVEYIVYHELLHALFPPEMRENGRRSVHSKKFQEEEKKFIHFQKAKAFEKNIRTVLRQDYGRT